MAKPAYAILDGTGTVLKVHAVDIGGVGTPTTSTNNLETLISLGYQQIREVALTNGNMLLVLSKP